MTLVETIRKHITEEGECWNWHGALQSCGTVPTMRWQKKTGAVRRFILLERGINQPGMLATYNCGNPNCVNPEHTKWAIRKTIQRRTTTELGYHANPLRRQKLALNARKRAKLTMALAQEIRAAEGNQYVIAARFGVSQATVSVIKRGETWRNYSNPFTGLGGL